MSDKKVGSSGSWDAKINAKPKAKDAAGKAMGYEDAGAQKREDGRLQETSNEPGRQWKELSDVEATVRQQVADNPAAADILSAARSRT